MSEERLPLRAAILWIGNLRNAALAACCATSAGLVIPLWNTVPQASALMQQWPRFKWLVVILELVIVAFSATFPVFLFTFSRDRGALTISRGHRRLASIAAVLAAVLLMVRLVPWVQSLGIYLDELEMLDLSVVRGSFDRLNFADVVLSALSTVSCVVLLVATARYQPVADTEQELSSRTFTVAAKVTVISWGVVLAGTVIRLLALPYIYSTVQSQMALLPQRPTFTQLYGEPISIVLDVATIFAIPFIVFRSYGKTRPTELENPNVDVPGETSSF